MKFNASAWIRLPAEYYPNRPCLNTMTSVLLMVKSMKGQQISLGACRYRACRKEAGWQLCSTIAIKVLSFS
jgi:hypothetical protein